MTCGSGEMEKGTHCGRRRCRAPIPSGLGGPDISQGESDRRAGDPERAGRQSIAEVTSKRTALVEGATQGLDRTVVVRVAYHRVMGVGPTPAIVGHCLRPRLILGKGHIGKGNLFPYPTSDAGVVRREEVEVLSVLFVHVVGSA